MKAIATRAYIVAGLMLGIGLFGLLGRGQAAVRKTEQYLEEKAPTTVKGYRMIPGQEGGLRYTYKMDEGTYKSLKPFGIVARQFTDGGAAYDAVLITSDSHESFHDPKICFSSQGWTFRELREETLDIPGLGPVPMTIAEMDGPRTRAVAAYLYRGPNGFVANPKRLQLDMFREVLLGRAPKDATFYRFMPASEGVGLEPLKAFIREYMIAARESSGGYF
ncbi:MAG: exosortase-associated EpsI family protein [Fimbriimonas sp.]